MSGLPSQGEKIMIIHSGGIGDLLLALPAMRMFRRAFPHAALALLGRPERLALVAFDLGAQSIHSIDRAGMAYLYADGGPLPAELSDFFSAFGAVLVFGRSSVLAANLKKAGAVNVILLPSFPPEEEKVHVTDYLVDSLRTSGFEKENSSRPLQLPDDPSDSAGSFFGTFGWTGGHVLAIHPGSGGPAKNWSPENFAKVADRAGERTKILLISGPAQDGVAAVRRAMKKKDSFIAENLSLLQLAGLLKRSTAYLGNDSGITHLAAALGLPTVAIFGPTDPAVWGPRGSEIRILYEKKSCSPCSPETRSGCSCPSLKKIEPDRVLAELSPLLP